MWDNEKTLKQELSNCPMEALASVFEYYKDEWGKNYFYMDIFGIQSRSMLDDESNSALTEQTS